MPVDALDTIHRRHGDEQRCWRRHADHRDLSATYTEGASESVSPNSTTHQGQIVSLRPFQRDMHFSCQAISGPNAQTSIATRLAALISAPSRGRSESTSPVSPSGAPARFSPPGPLGEAPQSTALGSDSSSAAPVNVALHDSGDSWSAEGPVVGLNDCRTDGLGRCSAGVLSLTLMV